MPFHPKNAPSGQRRFFPPIEIITLSALACCFIGAVVPQFHKYAQRYEYASAAGEGTTFMVGSFFCLVLAAGVIWIAARLIMHSEEDRRDTDEDGAADG